MKREDTSHSATGSIAHDSHISFLYYSSELKFDYSLIEWDDKMVINCEGCGCDIFQGTVSAVTWRK